MGTDALKVSKILDEVKTIHDDYFVRWQLLEDDLNKYDDFIIDLLNELEDVFNPSRLNGN